MGYRVEYGPVKKVRGLEKRVSRISALIGVCLLIFLVLVGCLWPEGKYVLQKLVFLGDPAVTAAALEDLTDNLRSGEDLSDGLSEFCIRILEAAKIDSPR